MGVGHVRVFSFKAEVGSLVDNGVFEEATGGAMFFGTGELAPAEVDNGLAELLGGVVREVFEGLVAEIGGKRIAETIGDTEDEVTTQMMLEEGVAVGKPAVGIGENAGTVFFEIVGFDGIDKIFGLSTIGTYILHRRRSHGARDGGEVLESIKAMIESPLH